MSFAEQAKNKAIIDRMGEDINDLSFNLTTIANELKPEWSAIFYYITLKIMSLGSFLTAAISMLASWEEKSLLKYSLSCLLCFCM